MFVVNGFAFLLVSGRIRRVELVHVSPGTLSVVADVVGASLLLTATTDICAAANDNTEPRNCRRIGILVAFLINVSAWCESLLDMQVMFVVLGVSDMTREGKSNLKCSDGHNAAPSDKFAVPSGLASINS